MRREYNYVRGKRGKYLNYEIIEAEADRVGTCILKSHHNFIEMSEFFETRVSAGRGRTGRLSQSRNRYDIRIRNPRTNTDVWIGRIVCMHTCVYGKCQLWLACASACAWARSGN